MKIGNYDVERYLGEWSEQVPVQPGILAGDYTSYRIKIGIVGIYDIREAVEGNPTQGQGYKVSDDVMLELKSKFDFYKISLVSDFLHDTDDIKFKYGKITLELDSSPGQIKPYVYSIAPLKVDKTTTVSKKFGVDPSVKLSEIEFNPGISYAYGREYEELHPQIVGHFSAAQDAWWEYFTPQGIDDIRGAQLVECIIKQPKDMRSIWRLSSEGEYRWSKFWDVAKSWFTGKGPQTVPSAFKMIEVPFE